MEAPSNTSNNQFIIEEEAVDLGHYWRVIMRYKWIIAALGIIFAAITALIAIDLDDTYTSTVTLSVDSDQQSITSIQDIYSGGGGPNAVSIEDLNSQVNALENRKLAEQVIREMNLLENPEFVKDKSAKDDSLIGGIKSFFKSFQSKKATPKSADPAYQEYVLLDSVIKKFNKRLGVRPIDNTNLVNVSFEAEDPQLAANIVNTLAEVFIANDIAQRLDTSRAANIWLTERLQRLKLTLDQSEQKLQDFLVSEQLIDIEGIASLNIQELDLLSRQSLDDQRSSREADNLYKQAQELKQKGVSELLSFPAILNHESMRLIRDNSSQTDQLLAELGKKYGRNHPRIIALNAERVLIQESLEVQALRVINSIESDYETATANERVSLSRLEQSKIDLQDVNLKNFVLEDLQREVETNQELYNVFFTRIRETDEISDFESANASITDPAVPSIEPSAPNRKLLVLLALAGGIILGSFIALFRDFLDNTLKNPSDIEEQLNLPNLGTVPLADRSRAEKKDALGYLGFVEDPHSKFSEALRTLRTSINLSSLDKPYKIIELTSSVPNEGKTTLSINLASVMGQMNKVLLIDMDMRRPSLGKSLGLDTSTPGITDYMIGKSQIKDCIHHIKDAKFHLLPAGGLVPNPLELIESKRFKHLIAQLSTKFHTIIIDTPPMQAVSDGLVISTLADAVLYVVKADSTPVNTVKGELLRLRQTRANVIGVVLNQVDLKKLSAYGYGDYYDSYGYSEYKATPES